jgi:hypothetical protein
LELNRREDPAFKITEVFPGSITLGFSAGRAILVVSNGLQLGRNNREMSRLKVTKPWMIVFRFGLIGFMVDSYFELVFKMCQK